MTIDNKKFSILKTILFVIFFCLALYQYAHFEWKVLLHKRSDNDFKHFYFGSEVLKLGGNPYDSEILFHAAHRQGVQTLNPYVYLPFTGLILMPIMSFPFQKASQLWYYLNHIWLWLSIIILMMSLSLNKKRAGLTNSAEAEKISFRSFCWGGLFIFVVASFSIPFFRNLSAGQMNTFILLIYSLMYLFYLRDGKRAEIVSGFFAGFGTLFKISPGIFLIFFILKKRWYSVLGMVGAIFVFLLLSILLFGIDINLSFIPVLKQMGYGQSTWSQFGMTYYKDPFNQSFNAFFYHIFVDDGITAPLINGNARIANYLTILMVLILFAIGIYTSFKIPNNIQKPIIKGLDFSLFIFLSLLIPSLFWDHYLVQLWIAYFFIFFSFFEGSEKDCWKRNPIGAGLKIAIFVLCIIFLNIHIQFDSPDLRSGLGLIIMSAKLWFTLILFFLTIFQTKKAMV